MKLSEEQFLMMLSIVKGTINIANEIGFYNSKQRLQLVNDIVTQQSEELVDLIRLTDGIQSGMTPQYEVNDDEDTVIIHKTGKEK